MLRTRSNSLSSVLVVPLFLLVGLGLCVGGGYWGWITYSFMQTASRAPGTVVEVTQYRDSEGDNVYSPVVEYTLPSGRTVRFEEDLRSSPPSHRVGDEVEVLYNPENPEEARINSVFNVWFGPGLLLGLGVCFGSVAFLVGLSMFMAFARGR
jgi:hypothetical protein